jgi:hypothetical protein
MIDPRRDPRQGGPAQLEGGDWQLVARADSHARRTFDPPWVIL